MSPEDSVCTFAGSGRIKQHKQATSSALSTLSQALGLKTFNTLLSLERGGDIALVDAAVLGAEDFCNPHMHNISPKAA